MFKSILYVTATPKNNRHLVMNRQTGEETAAGGSAIKLGCPIHEYSQIEALQAKVLKTIDAVCCFTLEEWPNVAVAHTEDQMMHALSHCLHYTSEKHGYAALNIIATHKWANKPSQLFTESVVEFIQPARVNRFQKIFVKVKESYPNSKLCELRIKGLYDRE